MLWVFNCFLITLISLNLNAKSAQVLDKGKRIVFEAKYPGLKQFKLLTLQAAPSTLRVEAPAQVVAAIQADKSIIFAQADMTSLYSQYLQSLANLERNEKNKHRLDDMYKNQAATARELNEAQNELTNAKTAKTEFEVRLKSAGLDPHDLKIAKAKTVWLLAEMPEDQVHEVEKGESVKSTFSSFPGQTFLGKADAIADVVDASTRTVKIRVSLDNAKALLKPGMFARCDFGQPQTAAISLPLSSIVTVEQQNFVFVAQNNNSFERRAIALLSSNDKEALVSTGLKPGEKVVVSGVMLLKGLSFGY